MHAHTTHRCARVLAIALLALGLLVASVQATTTSARAAVGHVRLDGAMDDATAIDQVAVGDQAARLALRQRGVAYVFAGASPSGFDCSGLVAWAYGLLGRELPHSTDALWIAGTRVPRGQLEPGDLVFFYGQSHVGLYIGSGRFVHAPRPGEVVRVARLTDPWFSGGYDGAVRVS
jgi:cell wall-associated NlpC family hydrolase